MWHNCGMTDIFRVRIERSLVKKATRVAEEIGTTPGEIVRMLFAQLVRQRAIPFSLSAGRTDDLLDIEDVLGKRLIQTRLHRNITIREENATTALEDTTYLFICNGAVLFFDESGFTRYTNWEVMEKLRSEHQAPVRAEAAE